jgi:geranylgeranyl diphosphate synthase, type II
MFMNSSARTSELLENALERTLRRMTPEPLFSMAEYALRGGKRLRGSLCLEVAYAVGSTREKALPFAVAVEFVHAASLLLDDLPSMDDAQTRRGRPCLHLIHGVAATELTAITLVAEAFRTLCSASIPSEWRIVAVEGQATVIGDMCWGQLVSAAGKCPADEQKTAALFGYAARAGALAGNQNETIISELDSFGRILGLAYQAFDDHADALSPESANAAGAALQHHLGQAQHVLGRLPEPPREHLKRWFCSFKEMLVI